MFLIVTYLRRWDGRKIILIRETIVSIILVTCFLFLGYQYRFLIGSVKIDRQSVRMFKYKKSLDFMIVTMKS